MIRKLISVSLFFIIFFRIYDCQETNGDNATLPKQTYKEAEKEILNFINEQLRSLLPRMVGGAGTTNLSPKCMASMMKIFGNVRRLKGWTLKFLDSIGKPTAGILKGASYSLGHYDECVDLSVTSKGYETQNISEAIFQGMYCKIKIQFANVVVENARSYHKKQLNATDLGKLKELIQETIYIPGRSDIYGSHFVGVCLPSTCTYEDVQDILTMVSFPGTTILERCEIKSNIELNRTEKIVLYLFLALICICCVSTFSDWLLHNKIEDKFSLYGDRRCVSVTVAFSFCNNTKRLMKNIEDDTDNVLAGHCVRGIVVASVGWIILGHTYLLPYDIFYLQSSSLENLQNYYSKMYFSHIVNYPLAIDALFVCFGFIMTYTLWYAACRSEDVKVNIIRLIIQNYLRIFIPVIICLGIIILLPIIGSGPFWKDFADQTIPQCYKNPWAYVGMYSNILDESEQCLPHLWFASCLAQLTLVGIILSWILSKNTRFGIILIVLLTLAGNITVGIYTYDNNFHPSYIAYFMENSSDMFWKMNYSLPLSHFGPYALGMLMGIFVARRSSHPLKPCIAAIGWIICLCILESLIYFTYKYHTETMDVVWSAMYAGSHRTIFAFCVSWIIVACSFGNGGFVNAILSCRIFDPLFRLSYYSYMFHFIFIAFTVGVAREHFYYSHLDMMLKAVSYIVSSYFLSYFLYMIFELPLKNLCGTLRGKKSSRIDVTSLNNFRAYKTDVLAPNNIITGTCKMWAVSSSKNGVSN